VGLDMYLTAKRYLSDYDLTEKQLKQEIDKVLDTKIGSVKEVSLEAGYWRKANAIHKWFVDTVQDGLDECQETSVTLEQLQELSAIVNMVLADNSLAGEILPPTEGFFFGGTEIDDWYLEYLKDTKDILDKILTNPDSKNWQFYYQSSW
jgi:hypothetical protein